MQLLPHPSSLRTPAVRRVTAEVAVRGPRLAFEYRVEGEVGRISWPQAVVAERTDGLWRHTCFEAFIAAPGRPAYVELNFSPSGAWAAYRLSGYRSALRPLDLAGVPPVVFEAGRAAATLHAGVDLGSILAALAADAPVAVPVPGVELDLALCAVIEEDSGERSYWALRHGAAQPDFHRRDGFTLAQPVAARAPREGEDSA